MGWSLTDLREELKSKIRVFERHLGMDIGSVEAHLKEQVQLASPDANYCSFRDRLTQSEVDLREQRRNYRQLEDEIAIRDAE